MHTIRSHIRQFIFNHDEIPAFHAAYLTLTIIAAAMLNLGVFALLIAAHMLLDVLKYRVYLHYSWKLTAEGVLRESLVDVTLLSVGLIFAVYLHTETALAGVSSLLRAEITILRLFGTLLPRVKILHDLLKIVAHLRHYLQHAHPHLRTDWSNIDKFCFLVLALCVVLLLAAPIMLSVDTVLVQEIVTEEMTPMIGK